MNVVGFTTYKDDKRVGEFPAMAWQPIETAPRDGTSIFVYRPAYDGAAVSYKAGADVDQWKGERWFRSRPAQQPTHWMPIPPPPRS